MKKVLKTLSLVALCIVVIIVAVVPAFADTVYVENHDVIHCTNYYVDGANYRFLVKIPKGASLVNVTIKNTNFGSLINMAESENVEFQYSDSTSDYYMYTYYIYPGSPKDTWYSYGIKLYYDNGNEHYMATNASYGSTTEGPGYILIR